jgi:penicillin-binding protein 2
MSNVEDRRGIITRLSVLQYVITGLFSILAISFWVLQVAQHAKFEEMAENNHQRTLALRAPRGIVLDRDGRVLVENRPSFSISIMREHSKDLNRTIRMLAAVIGYEESAVREIVDRHRRDPTYRPVTIVLDASIAQVSAVRARRLELPDVLVEPMPTRRYPDKLAAHAFGYVGEVSDKEVSEDESLKSGDIVGQAGIEKVYNAQLMGIDGARRVVVNSVGREIRTLDKQDPVEGKRLQLTLDLDLQKAVEDGFRVAGFNGASVVLDPKNGEVLAFASLPEYDPNAFASGIDRASFSTLLNDPLKPLQDRAIQGRYQPGSTFKMAVALAGLEEGIITPEFRASCAGGATFYGHHFACWKKGDTARSICATRSSNRATYFYTVANLVASTRSTSGRPIWPRRQERHRLAQRAAGTGAVDQVEARKMHEKWYAGETISVGIGQGAVSLTPVSMAVYMSTLANGGTRVTPHLLKAVDEGKGWVPAPVPPPQKTVDIDHDKLQAIRDGLWGVVNGGGTGGRARIVGMDISGKTGTAQVISNAGRVAAAKSNRDLRDHGWFVFFAPRDKPEIAGVVFLEHGIHGPNAASVAHHILDTYFAKKEGRPLPEPPAYFHLDYKDPYARKSAPEPQN